VPPVWNKNEEKPIHEGILTRETREVSVKVYRYNDMKFQTFEDKLGELHGRECVLLIDFKIGNEPGETQLRCLFFNIIAWCMYRHQYLHVLMKSHTFQRESLSI
jgi:hypothetical protein